MGLEVIYWVVEDTQYIDRRVSSKTKYIQQQHTCSALCVCWCVPVLPTPSQKRFALTPKARTIYTKICTMVALVYNILSTKQESINIEQSLVLKIGIAAATTFICGALLFFSMIEEGKAEHFFSTETIAQYEERIVKEVLAMDTSKEYELKINGIQVNKDIYVAFQITIRYAGYLPEDLLTKWVEDNTQRWNEVRPAYWEDFEWRERAIQVIKLKKVRYVEPEGGVGGNAFGKARSWMVEVGIGSGEGSKILPKEAVEEKVKGSTGSFKMAIAKGGKALARIVQDAETRQHHHQRPQRTETRIERMARLDMLSGLRKPATGNSSGSDRQINNNENQVGTANCQFLSLLSLSLSLLYFC